MSHEQKEYPMSDKTKLISDNIITVSHQPHQDHPNKKKEYNHYRPRTVVQAFNDWKNHVITVSHTKYDANLR